MALSSYLYHREFNKFQVDGSDNTYVMIGNSDYAVDDANMPATPRTMPVSGEYRASLTTYTDGDVTVIQTDEVGRVRTSMWPSNYAVDDANMPATPRMVPVGGEFRKAQTTYTDGDATVLQTDERGNLRMLTPSTTALARTVDATISTSTQINLNASTTFLRVYAMTQDIYLKWGTTAVDATNFDEVIPANQICDFYVPSAATAVNLIERTATAGMIVIEK